MHTDFQSKTTSSENERLVELEKIKKNLEHQLQEMIAMAKHDSLTGLRNRQGIPELVNANLRVHCEGIFFIVDIDNFKGINDTYGHMEGDHVLVKFATMLKEAVNPKDIIARIGGDEFVVFSPGHYDKEEVETKAQRFIRQIESNLAMRGKSMRVTVSMGIAAAPLDGETYEILYGNADKALYSVKKEGKNGYRFFADLNEQERDDAVYDSLGSSLEEITSKLRERKIEGSFEVEYNNFEKIYRFMERNLIRDYREVQCVLFTLEDRIDASAMVIQRQMEDLHHAIISSLRKGDVTTKYSPTQILVLLIDVNKENAEVVVKRILSKYCPERGRDMMNVLYDIQQLMTGEETD